MDKVIIHISDLHISLHQNLNGTPANVKSWLTTEVNNESANGFIDHFIEFINTEFSTFEKFLIISGDIADCSEEQEYIYAALYINKIIERLSITKNNLLIVPGDHDIHRDSLREELRKALKNGIKKEAHLYNEAKYKHFSSFYSEIKNKPFNHDLVIIDKIEISKNILLLGLNSNYKINDVGGLGYIDNDDLSKELTKICDEFPNHYKIAVVHHNIIANYENKETGQWDENNRKYLIQNFERFKINLILNGNEHTRGSSTIKNTKLYVSDSGQFTAKEPQGCFKCYLLTDNKEVIKLENKIALIQNRRGLDDIKSGYWSFIDPNDIKEEKEFIFYKNEVKEEVKVVDNLDSILNSYSTEIIDNTSERKESYFYSNKEISNKLYNIIRQKKLFHTGHFHWSETSRAHNWIDISKILEDKEDLSFVKNSIINVIETCGLGDNFDFIIGLGTEGNIISTRTSVKYNKPYSPLPYSYRYDEHNDFEKKLNFENNGEYKSVLVITDVVNDGRTIRKLIAKREKIFFEKVEKIIVISLIYTGDCEKMDTGILNTENIQDFDSINDEKVNNIEYYTVLSLKVEKCPYKDDFRDSCLIYKDGLSCVHLFYDEKKAKDKISTISLLE